MDGELRLLPIYARIWRTYFARARSLLPLAAAVFVPLGLIDAIPLSAEVDSLTVGNGLLLAAVLVVALAMVATSLVGEVFYSGAVGLSMTHRRADGGPLGLREIARRIAYRRLIAVDIVYTLLVIAGFALLAAPGIAAYVWLGLAGPVVEIEQRGVRAALLRSARLVRGRFWLVFAVLVPLELASEAVGGLADLLTRSLLGHGIWADWLAESVSNVIATPFVAVASVLLTLELIAAEERATPRLDSAPASR